MNKTLLRCAAVILCILLMTVPCFGDSYGTVVNYTSVKFPGAVSTNYSTGQYILVQAEDFLPYICLISQYSSEFERYFTNNIYDLALIRFNNSSDQDFVVPIMRIGAAQPLPNAPSTIQVNGRLIAWDGVNDPTFNAIDFPFNIAKTITNVDFGSRTASYLLACDNNNRVICCNNENGEYELIQNIVNSLVSIRTTLDSINTRVGDSNLYFNDLVSAITSSRQGLPYISSEVSDISDFTELIYYSIDFISEDTASMINDYFSVYFPNFDTDLESIKNQLQYFYQSFLNYMSQINTHLQVMDDNIQDIHDEMSGEALKDFTVQTTDGQSPSLWQVIKNSLGWMMSPFGKFFSMIMDSSRLFNNAGNGWNVLYDITSASETYDPVRIVVP